MISLVEHVYYNVDNMTHFYSAGLMISLVEHIHSNMDSMAKFYCAGPMISLVENNYSNMASMTQLIAFPWIYLFNNFILAGPMIGLLQQQFYFIEYHIYAACQRYLPNYEKTVNPRGKEKLSSSVVRNFLIYNVLFNPLCSKHVSASWWWEDANLRVWHNLRLVGNIKAHTYMLNRRHPRSATDEKITQNAYQVAKKAKQLQEHRTTS